MKCNDGIPNLIVVRTQARGPDSVTSKFLGEIARVAAMAPARADSVARAMSREEEREVEAHEEQRRQQCRGESLALHHTMRSELQHKPAEIVAAAPIWRNRTDPATMRYAVRWEGWTDNSRFATETNTNGLTWQLETQFTKGNGKLRDAEKLLKNFKAFWARTRSGNPTNGSFKLPFAKSVRWDHVAARAGYEWINKDGSMRESVRKK